MDIELLSTVIPLVTVLFLCDIWLYVKYLYMEDVGRKRLFGGIQGNLFGVWVVSFIFSSIGLMLSFYVLVFTVSQGSYLLFIFFNIALIIYNFALMYENVIIVFACLSVVFFNYISIFIFIMHRFPVSDTSVYTYETLYIMHVCNFIGILHASIIDLCIWQYGWWEQLESPYQKIRGYMCEFTHWF
jgi:hypothetical protein